MRKIKLPKIRRPAVPAPPAPVGRGRTRLKYGPEGKPARTRAQLADRAELSPPRVQGPRQTVMSDRAPEHGRNYPVRGNLRRQAPAANTRAQLAERRGQRAAQGHAETRHPKSGEGARSSVRGVGRAQRPPSALPGNKPAGRHRADPQPETYGRGSFASAFFGRPPKAS